MLRSPVEIEGAQTFNTKTPFYEAAFKVFEQLFTESLAAASGLPLLRSAREMRESAINAGKVPKKHKYNFAFSLVFIRSTQVFLRM